MFGASDTTVSASCDNFDRDKNGVPTAHPGNTVVQAKELNDY